MIANSSYLRRINTINRQINLGDIDLGKLGIKKTEITYTAQLNSARKMHQKTDLILARFLERKNDSKWAQLSSAALDIKSTMNTRINAELLKIRQIPMANLAINKLVDMGRAIKIDEKAVAVFDGISERALGTVEPAIKFAKSIKENVTTKYQIVNGILKEIKDAPKIQSLLSMGADTSVVNLVPEDLEKEHPAVEQLEHVGVISSNHVVQYVMTESGKLTQQVLDADGNVVLPANKIEDELVQRVVSMDGMIVEQSLIANTDGTFSVDISEGSFKQVSSASEAVIEEIHSLVYKEVHSNLEEMAEAGIVDSNIVEMTKLVNEIGTVEFSVDVEKKKMSDLDKLINQIVPIPDHEAALQAITDHVIVETAIETQTYSLEQLDLHSDEAARLKALELLVSKGVVSGQVAEDPTLSNEVLEAMSARKDSIPDDAIIKNLAQRQVVDKTPSLAEAIAMATAAAVVDDAKKNFQKAKDVTLEELETIKKVYESQASGETGKTEKKGEKRKKSFKDRKRKSDSGESEYTDEDLFRVYVSGAVLHPGRVDMKIGTRIRDAVIKAGVMEGVTDWDGLNNWLGMHLGLNIDSPIGEDGLAVWVPRIQDKDDEGPTEEEVQEMLDRCRPKVKVVAEKYMKSRNIQNIKDLRKIVHQKMVISQLKKDLIREDISTEQIEQLLEEYISDPESEKFLSKADKIKAGAKIVNVEDISPSDEFVEGEAERESGAVVNSVLEQTEKLLSQVTASQSIQSMLESLDEVRKVTVSGASRKQEEQARLRQLSPDEMMRKMSDID